MSRSSLPPPPPLRPHSPISSPSMANSPPPALSHPVVPASSSTPHSGHEHPQRPHHQHPPTLLSPSAPHRQSGSTARLRLQPVGHASTRRHPPPGQSRTPHVSPRTPPAGRPVRHHTHTASVPVAARPGASAGMARLQHGSGARLHRDAQRLQRRLLDSGTDTAHSRLIVPTGAIAFAPGTSPTRRALLNPTVASACASTPSAAADACRYRASCPLVTAPPPTAGLPPAAGPRTAPADRPPPAVRRWSHPPRPPPRPPPPAVPDRPAADLPRLPEAHHQQSLPRGPPDDVERGRASNGVGGGGGGARALYAIAAWPSPAGDRIGNRLDRRSATASAAAPEAIRRGRRSAPRSSGSSSIVAKR